MTVKDYGDYVNDMLSAIQETEDFTKGMSLDDFIEDRKTINAVVRSIEVIGEAAKNIPEDLRAQYSTIPWKKMSGMRDKLIHEYFGVDLGIVWNVIKEDLPPLIPSIKKMKKNMKV